MLKASARNRSYLGTEKLAPSLHLCLQKTKEQPCYTLYKSFSRKQGLGSFFQEASSVEKLHFRTVTQWKTGQPSSTSTRWVVTPSTGPKNSPAFPRFTEQLSSTEQAHWKQSRAARLNIPHPQCHLQPSLQRKPTCPQKRAEQSSLCSCPSPSSPWSDELLEGRCIYPPGSTLQAPTEMLQMSIPLSRVQGAHRQPRHMVVIF